MCDTMNSVITMEVLSASLIQQAKKCLDKLAVAIAQGDTQQVRKCAENIRRGGVENGLRQLVALADELEKSAIICDLGASLRCMDAIREVLGFNLSAVSSS